MKTILHSSLVLLGLWAAPLSAQTPPKLPPVKVTLQVATANTGSVAEAKVVFPDGYWQLDDPGVAVRDGAGFAIDAEAVQIYTLVPPSGPAVFELQYPLGLLPADAYSLTYRINGGVAGVFPFTVRTPAIPFGEAPLRARSARARRIRVHRQSGRPRCRQTRVQRAGARHPGAAGDLDRATA